MRRTIHRVAGPSVAACMLLIALQGCSSDSGSSSQTCAAACVASQARGTNEIDISSPSDSASCNQLQSGIDTTG